MRIVRLRQALKPTKARIAALVLTLSLGLAGALLYQYLTRPVSVVRPMATKTNNIEIGKYIEADKEAFDCSAHNSPDYQAELLVKAVKAGNEAHFKCIADAIPIQFDLQPIIYFAAYHEDLAFIKKFIITDSAPGSYPGYNRIALAYLYVLTRKDTQGFQVLYERMLDADERKKIDVYALGDKQLKNRTIKKARELLINEECGAHAIYQAAKNGSLETLREVISTIPPEDPEDCTPPPKHIVMEMAFNDPDRTVFDKIVKAMSDDDRVDVMSRFPYLPEIAQRFIDNGVINTRRSRDGATPLMLLQQVHNITALLNAGADINVRDKRGRTALDYVDKQDTLSWGMLNAAAIVPHIAAALKKRDFAALAKYVNPATSLRFTPYACNSPGTIDLTVAELNDARLGTREFDFYLETDNDARPLSFKTIFDRYFYDQDYARSARPQYHGDSIFGEVSECHNFSFSSLAIFVEYAPPATNGRTAGSLVLVFEYADSGLYLTNIAHACPRHPISR